MYYWCRRAGLQKSDVENVGQDVFLAVARKLGEFKQDSTGGTFRGWLRTITHSKLCDYWSASEKAAVGQGGSSAQEQWKNIPAVDEGEETTGALSTERAILLQRALDILRTDFEERTWRAFWRFAIDGVPAAEVSVELGVTVNAVHQAVKRVRKRFGEEFAEVIEPPLDLSDVQSGNASAIPSNAE